MCRLARIAFERRIDDGFADGRAAGWAAARSGARLMGVDATTIARARLHPDESQRVFRVLVDALASPGRTYRLPHDVVGRAPMALVPLLAMCDIEVSITVLPDRHDWAGVVTAVDAPVTRT
jgi:hypothetical protein